MSRPLRSAPRRCAGRGVQGVADGNLVRVVGGEEGSERPVRTKRMTMIPPMAQGCVAQKVNQKFALRRAWVNVVRSQGVAVVMSGVPC